MPYDHEAADRRRDHARWLHENSLDDRQADTLLRDLYATDRARREAAAQAAEEVDG